MNSLLPWQGKKRVLWEHLKFYLSRKISYPLVKPDMLQLCFLFRCNLNCKMCSMQERAEIVKRSGMSYELSSQTIKDLIEQAANMGIGQLYLVGGEPFLREDVFDIIKFAHGYNMRTIVTTNGTLLGDPRIIEGILESKLHNLAVSFDGACENSYKNIRGEGIFEKIKANVQLLNRIKKEKKSSLPYIHISSTIMNQNIEELIDIVYLAKELEVEGIGFQPVVMDNTNQGLRDKLDSNWIPECRYNILDESIDKLLEYKLSNKSNLRFIYSGLTQLRLAKKYFRGRPPLYKQKCYMGFSRIIISQDGKMYFCAEEPDKGEISFGDVRKDRLRDLWYSAKARVFRKNIKRCKKPCLLGCTRRSEFDSLMDSFYYEFFYKHLRRFNKINLPL